MTVIVRMPVAIHLSSFRHPMPSVDFCLSTTDHPIDEKHPLWHRPLPTHRLPATRGTRTDDSEIVTYGRYFSAIAGFCAATDWKCIVQAATQKLARPVHRNDLGRLTVCLVKHGACYHPARLQVTIEDQTLSFVVNVAASHRGREVMSREVKALERLNRLRPFDWLPRVYGGASAELPMFLGDWFDDFHEFHLNRRPGHAETAIEVWDGAAVRNLLSEKQTAGLYRNAAMILTACYDPITTCQIFPWHHAAGDFVVKVEGEQVAVKLITARDYVALGGAAAEPQNERALLDALMLFFIHLSVRMRLDRLDGVGAVVWAPDHCLAPLLVGFFQGLELTARMCGFPESFPEIVRQYFCHHDTPALMTLQSRVAEAVFHAHSEERHIVASNLNHHIDGICQLLSVG